MKRQESEDLTADPVSLEPPCLDAAVPTEVIERRDSTDVETDPGPPDHSHTSPGVLNTLYSVVPSFLKFW